MTARQGIFYDRLHGGFIVRGVRPSDGKLTYICRARTRQEANELLDWWNRRR
jgi:hypothetical protein